MNDLERFSGAAAWDVRGLDAIKREAKASSPLALRSAAQQMEGMFVQQMLKSMREAGFKDGLFNNQASDMYTSMYDQQIAQDIAQKGQLGFADMIVLQLGGEKVLEAVKSAPSAGSSPYSLLESKTLPALAQTCNTVTGAEPLHAAEHGDKSQPFISRMLRPALQAALASGIHPHLILAQAALESGWGKREILTRDGQPSHNLFGIKATGDWKGKTTQVTTTEYVNGAPQKIKAAFRVYDSYTDALKDYTRLLKNNPRYQKVAQSSSPERGAQALQAGGYATDPAYAKKLITIIQKVKGNIDQSVQAYKTDLAKIF